MSHVKGKSQAGNSSVLGTVAIWGTIFSAAALYEPVIEPTATAIGDAFDQTFNKQVAPEPRCELKTNGKMAQAEILAKSRESGGAYQMEQHSGMLRSADGKIPAPGVTGVFTSTSSNTAFLRENIVLEGDIFSTPQVTPYKVTNVVTQVNITGWNGEEPKGTCSYINTAGDGVAEAWQNMPLYRASFNMF